MVAFEEKHVFTFLDLFSGIGGFRLALEELGGKSVGFSEINATARSVYKDNFELSPERDLGDITNVTDFPPADVIVGGVPCQSWSIAGKNKGFDDPRGRLWVDAIRSVESAKPKVFIFENVKGLADPRNRDNLDLILSEFSNLNYEVNYKVLNAFDFGLPQNRERIFLVGLREDFSHVEFQFPPKHTHLPVLAEVLEGVLYKGKKVKNPDVHLTSFKLAAKINKGNFFIFSDVRNGDHTIHSWDLIETSDREKEICLLILRNRRRQKYGTKDGNPVCYDDVKELLPDLKKRELDSLVDKSILLEKNGKYEFCNSKISSGINGVYRVFLPESHVFSTLTKTASRDYISEISIPLKLKGSDRNQYFIDEIYTPQKFRKISVPEAAKIQSFPHNFHFNTSYPQSMGLLGNAVAVEMVKSLGQELINVGVFQHLLKGVKTW